MPLYEYQCEACGHRFEQIRKFSDPPLEVCPVCGGKVNKQISSPAFAFKGTGWYVTDYAKKDSGSKEKDKDSKDSKDAKDAKDGKDSKDSKESKDTKDSGSAAKDSSKSESSSSSSSESSSSSASPSKPAAKD
jgi:putative FmdB family regulatory protein